MKIKIKEFIKALQLLEDQVSPSGEIEISSKRSYPSYHDGRDYFEVSSNYKDVKFDLRIDYTPAKYFVPKGFEDHKYKDKKWGLINEKFEIKMTKTESKDITSFSPVRYGIFNEVIKE